jgi:hypothetical protein
MPGNPKVRGRAERVDAETENGKKLHQLRRIQGSEREIQKNEGRQGDGDQVATRNLVIERDVDERGIETKANPSKLYTGVYRTNQTQD